MWTAWRSSPGQKAPARHRGHPVDRLRHGAFGRRGDAERGLQLSAQAAGHPSASRGHEKAAESTRLRRTNVELKRRLDEKFGFEGVVGDSRQMRDVIERLQAHRPDQRQRADPGRDGHRQGTGGPGHPSEQPAEEQALRGPELRRAEREHPGKRAVRPRERGVHRRLDRSRGQVRVRPRRHDVSRRSGRHAAGHADQASPGVGKRRDHPRRLERSDQGERAHPFGHQSQPGGRHRGRHVSQRPVSSPEGGHASACRH